MILDKDRVPIDLRKMFWVNLRQSNFGVDMERRMDRLLFLYLAYDEPGRVLWPGQEYALMLPEE